MIAPFQSPALAEVDTAAAPTVLERVAGWSDALWRAGGLLVVLIIALTVVRPFLLAVASRATAVATQPALLAGGQAAIAERPREATLVEVVRRNPEQTAQVIKVWLAGDESANA